MLKKKLKDIKAADIHNMVEGIPGNWFIKHFALVLTVVLLAMCYISVRYDCVTAMETVQKLNKRLEVQRTEVQRERSMYMSATCESAMQRMVDSLHLDLHIQEQPPYKITLP